MKRVYLMAFYLGVSVNLSAQVLLTRKDNEGTITKYMRMQFGKDTIQVGVPFKAKDKLGMGISISRTNDKNHFTFDLRSNERKLLTDSVNMHKASLLFIMSNKDTVKVKSLTQGHYDYTLNRSKDAIMLFIHAYLTDKQLAILQKNKVSVISFCLDDNTCIPLPVTNKEKSQFKNAIDYLLN